MPKCMPGVDEEAGRHTHCCYSRLCNGSRSSVYGQGHLTVILVCLLSLSLTLWRRQILWVAPIMRRHLYQQQQQGQLVIRDAGQWMIHDATVSDDHCWHSGDVSLAGIVSRDKHVAKVFMVFSCPEATWAIVINCLFWLLVYIAQCGWHKESFIHLPLPSPPSFPISKQSKRQRWLSNVIKYNHDGQ